MRKPKSNKSFLFSIMLMQLPALVWANPVETVGAVLDRQLAEENGIKAGQAQPAIPTPVLAPAKKTVQPSTISVDAIWGMKGKEVVEFLCDGRRIPVSLYGPYARQVNGWQLESVTPMQVTLTKGAGKTFQRQIIEFDWKLDKPVTPFSGGNGTSDSIVVPNISSNVMSR